MQGLHLCVDLCPVQAFTGVPFNPEEPVQVRFNTRLCREYLRERDKSYGARVCGVCIHVCPHGYSVKRKKDSPPTSPRLLREQLGAVRSRFSDSLRPRLLETIRAACETESSTASKG